MSPRTPQTRKGSDRAASASWHGPGITDSLMTIHATPPQAFDSDPSTQRPGLLVPAWATELEVKWRTTSASRDRGRLRETATCELPSGELATLEVLPGLRVGLERYLARASVIYRRIEGADRSVRACRSADVHQLRGSSRLAISARSNRPEVGCAEVAEDTVPLRADPQAIREVVARVCDRVGLWAAASLLGEAAILALATRDEASLALASADYQDAVYCGPICQLRGEPAVVVPSPGARGEIVVARFCRVDLARIYLGWHAYDAADLEIAS